MALLLAWNRKVLEYNQFVWEKRWNERTQTTGNWGCGPLVRLSQQTLGLLGFGRIARAVTQRALGFGMKILANTRHPDHLLAQRIGVELTSREELVQRSDYISLHLPLTNDTRQLINVDTIRMMKPGAISINTSRGGLVDEDALTQALRTGHLGGALLDVYEHAPLPVEHPLRILKNIILTPHVAFYSEDALLELRRRTGEAVLRHLV